MICDSTSECDDANILFNHWAPLSTWLNFNPDMDK